MYNTTESFLINLNNKIDLSTGEYELVNEELRKVLICCSNNHYQVRLDAAIILGRVKTSKAIDSILYSLLKDINVEVRIEAAQSLAYKTLDKDVILSLQVCIREETNAYAKSAMIIALYQISVRLTKNDKN